MAVPAVLLPLALIHINMHYTPSTTFPTASTFLSTQLTQSIGSGQNGTRCRDSVKVLWCHSYLIWLVFEGSIPTCACFHIQKTFFVTFYNHTYNH